MNRTLGTFAAIALLALSAAQADARTIIMNASDACDRMAGIDEAAPRQGWAMHESSTGVYTNSVLRLQAKRRFLFRFALDEIPKDQRIAHAELILPMNWLAGNEPRFYLWRVLADWGPGACWDYASQIPKKTEWTRKGASGPSSDRATRPTDIIRLTQVEEITINVTEDVALWYSGRAPNRGWMLSVEDPGVQVQFVSPAWGGGSQWKLRLTYEPK